MVARTLALFTLAGTEDYAKRMSIQLETPISLVEERSFEDGEHKIRPLVTVEGIDAYVIHALYGDETHSVNDKLCRLLFLIAALKDHGAARVTAVTPYLCYARKDRRTQLYDPVTSRYVAALFEAMHTDRVSAVEVHNVAAFENAFSCPTQHIETAELFASHFAPLARDNQIVVVSPDAGGVKRAEQFRRALEGKSGQTIDNAFVEKYRSGGVVTGGALVGSLEGKTAIILDDLISTGTTLLRAAKACRAAGAVRVYAAATHGLFIGKAAEMMKDPLLDGLVVTDTVPPFRLDARSRGGKLIVLDSTRLVAEAVNDLRSHA